MVAVDSAGVVVVVAGAGGMVTAATEAGSVEVTGGNGATVSVGTVFCETSAPLVAAGFVFVPAGAGVCCVEFAAVPVLGAAVASCRIVR